MLLTSRHPHELLCNKSFSEWVFLQPESTTSLDALKMALCNIDVDKLRSELAANVDLKRIRSAVEGVSIFVFCITLNVLYSSFRSALYTCYM